MTLRECYEQLGCDYEAAVKRLCGKEEMLAKFVKKFPADPTYNGLVESYEGGDAPTAFRMAHTLKGLTLNFGFDKLQKSGSELCEALRGKDEIPEDSKALYEAVKRDYEEVVTAVKAVD